MLHLRHGRRSDAGFGSRRLQFTPGEISRTLIEAYALETQPQEDEIAADISL